MIFLLLYRNILYCDESPYPHATFAFTLIWNKKWRCLLWHRPVSRWYVHSPITYHQPQLTVIHLSEKIKLFLLVFRHQLSLMGSPTGWLGPWSMVFPPRLSIGVTRVTLSHLCWSLTMEMVIASWLCQKWSRRASDRTGKVPCSERLHPKCHDVTGLTADCKTWLVTIVNKRWQKLFLGNCIANSELPT